MALLEVRNLTVAIKKGAKVLKAVNDVSFSINEGEILGLAGESGCGKSTIVLSIPNLLPEKAQILNGEIIYGNQVLTSLKEKELQQIRGKEIAVIFQEYRQALNPLMKVGRQITETLELIKDKKKPQRTQSSTEEEGEKKTTHIKTMCNSVVKKNETIALEMLDRLGFTEPEKIFNSYPHQLSGGMCQRVLAAIAAIGSPRLLLADEPSSSLDSESREHILSMLAQMNRDYGTAILIISHDLSVIQKFCTRYLIMYDGKIVEEGPSPALFSPLHPYTKGLAGAIPCKSKRGKDLDTIAGKIPSIEDCFAGCHFAPRCKKAQRICMESFPPASKTDSGRIVHCYFPEQESADG